MIFEPFSRQSKILAKILSLTKLHLTNGNHNLKRFFLLDTSGCPPTAWWETGRKKAKKTHMGAFKLAIVILIYTTERGWLTARFKKIAPMSSL